MHPFLIYRLITFDKSIHLCNHHHKWLPYAHPRSVSTFFCHSIRQVLCRTSQKWNHKVYTLGLASFAQHNVFEIHLYFSHISSVFLSNAKYFTVWIHQNFFIYSSFNRRLGCFQFGAIMNKVSLNIHI